MTANLKSAKPLRIAVQMDPIKGINIASDTTFLLMMCAQNRGHSLMVYEPKHLSLEDGRVNARAQKATLRNIVGDHVDLSDFQTIDLTQDVDVVLMRQDPPFDIAYITATYLLERIHPKTLVVNDPRSVRDCPEKLFATQFQGLQPPTLVSADPVALAAFFEKHGDCILKPLHGAAGSGVIKLLKGDPNLEVLVEIQTAQSHEPLVLQKYIPAISLGDKRIILVNGKIAGAINRVPPKGAVRSNLAVGGKAERVVLTPRDLEICAAVGPVLKEKGLMFVGLDVIGNYLTEINVTSPTGAVKLKEFEGVDCASLLWDEIEALRA